MRTLVGLLLVTSMAALACSAAPSAPAAAPSASARPATESPAAPVTGDAGTKAQPKRSADEAAIVKVFDEYREALAARDGTRAIARVDRPSIDKYETLRKQAVTGTKGDLDKLPIVDLIVVLRFRKEFAKDELQAKTGGDLLRVGVERGWIGEGVGEASSVTVQGDRAVVKLDETDESGMPFVRESEGWKLALGGLMDKVSDAVEDAYKKNGAGVTRSEFAARLVERAAGALDRKLLDGPRTR